MLDWQSALLPQGHQQKWGRMSHATPETGITFQVWLPPVSAPVATTDEQYSNLSSSDLIGGMLLQAPKTWEPKDGTPRKITKWGCLQGPDDSCFLCTALLLTHSPWQPFGEGGRGRKGDPPGRVWAYGSPRSPTQ